MAANTEEGSLNDIHRIGGGSVENLRLKPTDARVEPPGISVLRAPTPADAARQIREAFPDATGLHEASRKVGSTNVDKIRQAGFVMIPKPTRKLPNHHRITHSDGVAGFSDENLKRLAEAFHDTVEDEP